ncbi:hypothetical protein IMZ11_29820 [Microtetraspora sp. AC03309]|uniref:hypothetical protein n=1 Tax=Microtetraspora sp. AC03309 TaxID=2779376 RepID=UPI001E28A977|nr:hypothetical protein [Microtetraspora sp. AC03309]MCC5579831.1 hypothetical protein [Microtetraspora sp. AC03309]
MTETDVEREGRPDVVQIRIPSLRLGPIILVGLALIVVSLVLKAGVLARGYFIEDDFLFVGDAYEHGLTWDYLMRVHKGHLMPGALALVWVLSRVAPYNWFLVSSVMLALQAAASAGMLLLLRRLFGDRPGILVPLALYVFAPLTVPALSWWSAALNAVPLQVAMVFSLAAHVKFLRTGAVRHAWHGLAWAAFGMAFSTKGAFLPLVTFALTTAYFGPLAPAASWPRAIVRELRSRLRIWVAYVALLGVYSLVYVLQQGTAGDEGAGVPKADVAAGLLGWMLGRTFPTGVVGGPLNWGGLAGTGGLADPPVAMVVVSWLVLAGLVALTCLYRRFAWRAWAIAALYVVVADAMPTVLARGRYTALVGTETRYVADAVVVFAVCFALSALPLRGEKDAYRRRLPDMTPLATALLTVAFLAASVASVNAYGNTLTAADRIQPYVDNVRTSLAKLPAGAEIYPRPVPAHVVLPWNGDRRLTSRVLAPLADEAVRARMRDPGPAERPYVVDDSGRIVPVQQLFGFFDVVEDLNGNADESTGTTGEGRRAGGGGKRTCYALRAGAVAFPVESPGGPEGAGALAYTSTRPVSVEVSLGAVSRRLDLPATAENKLVYFPHAGAGAGLRVALVDPEAKGFCLKAVAFGAAVPAQNP